MAYFSTSDIYDYARYWRRVDDRTSMSFKVAACHDAHVVLFNHHLTSVAYEIIIGGSGNQFTVIRRERLLENKAEVGQ